MARLNKVQRINQIRQNLKERIGKGSVLDPRKARIEPALVRSDYADARVVLYGSRNGYRNKVYKYE